jgi:hypothetical protein
MDRIMKITSPGYFTLDDLRELVRLTGQWPHDAGIRLKTTQAEDSITVTHEDPEG